MTERKYTEDVLQQLLADHSPRTRRGPPTPTVLADTVGAESKALDATIARQVNA